MTKGDTLVERGAERLQTLADRAAARGDGVGRWLSNELREDAHFMRKLKPSLVKARARGDAPTNQNPSEPAPPVPPPAAETPAAAQTPPAATRADLGTVPKREGSGKRGGPPPLVIVGAALVAGIVLAKVIDWRGHAHPRD